MPDSAGLDANAGYLIAAALVTLLTLGGYTFNLASRLQAARARRLSAIGSRTPERRADS
jgi:hypothetical protein